MPMYPITSNDIVEELRLIQTLSRASDEGKTIIHFQDLYDFSDMSISPCSKESKVEENHLKH